MRASIAVVVVGLLAFGSCSSDDSDEQFSFELTEFADFDAEVYTFAASGDAVVTGPTGTNVGDLFVAVFDRG